MVFQRSYEYPLGYVKMDLKKEISPSSTTCACSPIHDMPENVILFLTSSSEYVSLTHPQLTRGIKPPPNRRATGSKLVFLQRNVQEIKASKSRRTNASASQIALNRIRGSNLGAISQSFSMADHCEFCHVTSESIQRIVCHCYNTPSFFIFAKQFSSVCIYKKEK